MKKRVAIIGAGPSGLISLKESLQHDLEPIAFEKQGDIGGIWNINTGSTWNSMHTNLSKFSCSFSDFPWNYDNKNIFPSSNQMFDYLKKFSIKFGLLPHIKFNTEVVNISNNKGYWSIKYKDVNGTNTENFDSIIIASGIFSSPNLPVTEKYEKFHGKKIHSKDYRQSNDFENENVLVVGGSLSAVEVAADLTKNAKQVIHAFHQPFWILNRYIHKNPSDEKSPSLPLDLIFYNRKFYNQSVDNCTVEEKNQKKNSYMELICSKQNNVEQLKISKEEFNKPIKIVISDHYVDKVIENVVIPKRCNFKMIENSVAVFEDGTEYPINSVIFATGFKINIPFLNSEILDTIEYDGDDQIQPLILYKGTVHPKLADIFFVGMYKGPYFAVMEQQAKWACKYFSGKIELPQEEEMLNGLQFERDIRDQHPRPQFPHSDYVKFADDIARAAKNFPDINKFKSKDSTLEDTIEESCKNSITLKESKEDIYNKFINDPVTPSHYNMCINPAQVVEEMNLLNDFITNLSGENSMQNY